MSKRIEQSIIARNIACAELRSIYQRATCTGPTADEISNQVGEIWRRLRAGKFPGWVRSHLDGYEQALRDDLYARNLTFGGFYKGRFYSVDRRRPDYYDAHGIDVAEYADDGKVTERGHYWTGFAPVRPYFISSSAQVAK